MTKTERKYRPVVVRAILDIVEMEKRPRRIGKNAWFAASEIFEYIHGHHGDSDWRYSRRYRDGRCASPGPDLVTRIINQLRQDGFLEYNVDSLGKTSEWRIPVFGTHGSHDWNAKRLANELLEIDGGSAAL